MFWKFLTLLPLISCVEKDISANLPFRQEAIFNQSHIVIETEPDGTGSEVETLTFTAGDSPITLYAVVRDEAGQFVSQSEPVTWTLLGAIGVLSPSATSVTFFPGTSGTGSIYASHPTLINDVTGLITVNKGNANRISIETAADGSGTELMSDLIIRGGAAQSLYAIIRDEGNNFIGNTEAVTWNISNPGTGILSTTLGTSTVFTPTTFGTTLISAHHNDFIDDSTGLLTIGIGPATQVSIEDREDGTGTAPTTFDLIIGGESRTVYAILRDDGGNFVSNSISVSWRLSNANGILSNNQGKSISITPVMVGSSALTANLTGLADDELPNVQINHGVELVKAKGNFSCALLTNGDLKCWGNNGAGQLGQEDSNHRGDDPAELGSNLLPINLGSNLTIRDFDVGTSHVCAIFTDDRMKCWGSNSNGQLGLGDLSARGSGINEMGDFLNFVNLGTGRTVKQISLGTGYSCAILDNDLVKCWGMNGVGQLGLEDTIQRGHTLTSIGDNLPYVNLGTGRTAKKITSGLSHTCAILDNDDLKCWGSGEFGKLGTGNTMDLGSLPLDMGDNLLAIDFGPRVVRDVFAGANSTCVIFLDRHAACFGRNSFGQAALGDNLDRGDDPGELGNNIELMKLAAGRTVQQLSLGNNHSCALLDNNDVKCFGNNGSGQLGQENTIRMGDNIDEVYDLVPVINLGTNIRAKRIVSGNFFNCVVTTNNQLKCFGFNGQGQLGQGHTSHLGDDTNEMGDNLNFVEL